jgi:hypothetical protein
MTYIQYRKECRLSNVEPTKADFLGITRTWEEIDARVVIPQPKAMSATAGQ